jgi:putative protease
LSVGDEIIVTGPTTGYIHVVVNEMMVNEASAQTAKKGDVLTTPIPEKIRPSDKIYKLTDA